MGRLARRSRSLGEHSSNRGSKFPSLVLALFPPCSNRQHTSSSQAVFVKLCRMSKVLVPLGTSNPAGYFPLALLRPLRIALAAAVTIHLVACVCWRVGHDAGWCDDVRQPDLTCSYGWDLAASSLDLAPLATQYADAVYFALSVMSGAGYDVVPQTSLESVVASVCIVLGVVLQALAFGCIPSAIDFLGNIKKVLDDEENNHQQVNYCYLTEFSPFLFPRFES